MTDRNDTFRFQDYKSIFFLIQNGDFEISRVVINYSMVFGGYQGIRWYPQFFVIEMTLKEVE